MENSTVKSLMISRTFTSICMFLTLPFFTNPALAQWDMVSCSEAKDWAKLAVVEYTTGRNLDQTLEYAKSLYGKTGGKRVSEDAALMAVRFTWRYLVNLGMPQSPPPPEMQSQIYNDIQNDFYNWCISS